MTKVILFCAVCGVTDRFVIRRRVIVLNRDQRSSLLCNTGLVSDILTQQKVAINIKPLPYDV